MLLYKSLRSSKGAMQALPMGAALSHIFFLMPLELADAHVIILSRVVARLPANAQ